MTITYPIACIVGEGGVVVYGKPVLFSWPSFSLPPTVVGVPVEGLLAVLWFSSRAFATALAGMSHLKT